MISVISQFCAGMTDNEVNTLVNSVVDPIGYYYRFAFPKGLIRQVYKEV
jgi:hypothetical protein